MTGAESTRTLAAPPALDLVRTCRPLTDGALDPTWQISAGRVERAMSTPDGPATVRADLVGDEVRCASWGPGSGWALARIDTMLGLHDDASGFQFDLHPLVARQARRRGVPRFGASLRVADSLAPVILGQRVTSREARRSWWRLVARDGTAAPGPCDLRLSPTPSRLARLSDADWHVLGVERRRADAIRRCVAVLPTLQRAADASSEQLQQELYGIPGVGPWTATSLAAVVVGDADAVLLGDLHVPNDVAHLLAGEPRGTDERMLQLLEPWRGHRGRVVRLLGGAGHAPRRGPKYNPLPIESW